MRKFTTSNGKFIKNNNKFVLNNPTPTPTTKYKLSLNLSYPPDDPSEFTYIQANNSEVEGQRQIIKAFPRGNVNQTIEIDPNDLTDGKFWLAISKSSSMITSFLDYGDGVSTMYGFWIGSIHDFKITGDGYITLDITAWEDI